MSLTLARVGESTRGRQRGAQLLPVLLLVTGLSAAPTVAFADPPPDFHWTIPAEIERISVPGRVTAQGLPMSLWAVRSRWTVDRLIQDFVDASERANFYVPPGKHQIQLSAHPQLTVYDARRRRTYTAIFQPNKDGTTTVIMGAGYVAERRPPSVEGVELPPGSREVFVSKAEGGQTVQLVAPWPEKRARRHFRAAIEKKGFREEEAGGLFRHPSGATAALSFEPLDAERTRVMWVETAGSLPNADTSTPPPR